MGKSAARRASKNSQRRLQRQQRSCSRLLLLLLLLLEQHVDLLHLQVELVLIGTWLEEAGGSLSHQRSRRVLIRIRVQLLEL